jgi:hypothetical protein
MNTQTYTGTLVVVSCGKCDSIFGMTREFYDLRRRDHQTWYCPNGHPRVYNGPSESEKARQEAENEAAGLRRRLANRDEDLRAERASHQVTKNQRRAAKGQLTKTKRRIANGVCPCCNRSFAQLHRHMVSQHPEYAEVAK